MKVGESMSINDVTLHLDIFSRTPAGTIFGNIDEKVVVIRWEDQSDFVEAATLGKMLEAEVLSSSADTIIFDMRRIGAEEGSPFDAALRLKALRPATLKRVGWLVANQELPLPAAVEQELVARGIKSACATTFEAVAKALAAGTSPNNRDLRANPGRANFQATYGGSCYSIPELRTTVLRSAGNHYDLPLAQDMYEKSFRLHAQSKATAFILDTSAIPPIQDLERYTFAFKALIGPICQTGMVQQLIHVRAGDPVFPPGTSTPLELAKAFESIEFVETQSVEQALYLIRATQGRNVLSAMAQSASA